MLTAILILEPEFHRLDNVPRSMNKITSILTPFKTNIKPVEKYSEKQNEIGTSLKKICTVFSNPCFIS
jgi:hypothetical protein